MEATLKGFVAPQVEVALNQLLEEEFLLNLVDYLNSKANENEPDSRNGFYDRIINFEDYSLTVRIPCDRLSKPKTKLLKPYSRRIAESLNDMICRHYLKLEYSDGLNALSEQTIMKMTKSLVNLSKEFHECQLPRCIAVYLDAIYVPLRRIYKEKRRFLRKKVVLVVLGITEEGKNKF